MIQPKLLEVLGLESFTDLKKYRNYIPLALSLLKIIIIIWKFQPSNIASKSYLSRNLNNLSFIITYLNSFRNHQDSLFKSQTFRSPKTIYLYIYLIVRHLHIGYILRKILKIMPKYGKKDKIFIKWLHYRG